MRARPPALLPSMRSAPVPPPPACPQVDKRCNAHKYYRESGIEKQITADGIFVLADTFEAESVDF